jgi:hypothetical protein
MQNNSNRYTKLDLQKAFHAGREIIKNPDYNYVFKDFNEYLFKSRNVFFVK